MTLWSKLVQTLNLPPIHSEPSYSCIGPVYSHIAARTDRSSAQHFRRLPLFQLHVIHSFGCICLCPLSIGWTQPPQLGRLISANQDATSAHIPMNALLRVQVPLEEVKTTKLSLSVCLIHG